MVSGSIEETRPGDKLECPRVLRNGLERPHFADSYTALHDIGRPYAQRSDGEVQVSNPIVETDI
jgi:hypothetical protein